MENRNSWLKELSRNEKMWAIELNAVPSMIKLQYTQLNNLAEEGQVYGVMLQIKDVYETLCKIPVIMALIVIEHNEAYKGEPIYSEIVSSYLSSPMSMGDWDRLGKLIIKADRQFHLPACLIEILKRTKKLYAKEITPDVPNVVNWRNDSIGHGALKFEDDESYQEEIKSLLLMLKEYFDGRGKYSVRGLYDTVYFGVGSAKLIGDQIMMPQDGNALKLFVASTEYEVNNFIDTQNLKFYLFDSFYRKKNNLVKYYYIDGKKELLRSIYFSDLYERYVERPNKDFLIQSEVISREDDMILEYLNEPSDYIEPANLVETIVETMDEIGHGIIALFMERGTGKTAFANQMNGLYQKSTLVKDCLSRCYHIQNAAIRGSGDFIGSVNFSFQHSSDHLQDIRSGAGEMPRLTQDTQKPAEDMAAFLNYYHRCYQKDYTVFILDGIDEITEQTSRIMDYLPASDLLDDGVFIILLSRLMEEETVLGTSKKYIERAGNNSTARIYLKRTDEENVRILNKYIEKQVQEGRLPCCIDHDELINRADYRFLFLKACTRVKPEIVLNNQNEFSFIASYLNYVLSFYGPTQKRMLKEIAVTIALFPSVSIPNYQLYLNCEITRTFVGLLNDLLPVLTVLHIDGENIYSFADAAYSEFVLEEYPDIVEDVIDSFYEAMGRNLEAYFQNPDNIRARITGLKDLPVSAMSEEELNSAKSFYAEGIIGAWKCSHNNETIRNKFFSSLYGVYLCANLRYDFWAINIAKGEIVSEELSNCMGEALYYCVQNLEDEVANKWCKQIAKEFNKPHFRELPRFDSFRPQVYRSKMFPAILGSIADKFELVQIDDWFWILIDNILFHGDEQSKRAVLQKLTSQEETFNKAVHYAYHRARLEESYGIDTYAWTYHISTMDLPPAQEERILNLQIHEYVKLVEFADVKYADDWHADYAKKCLEKIKAKGYSVNKALIPDNADEKIRLIAEGKLQTEYYREKNSEAISALLDFNSSWKEMHWKCKLPEETSVDGDVLAALYTRMCYERDQGDLGSFIELGFWPDNGVHTKGIDTYIIRMLKNEYGCEENYYQQLLQWIETVRNAAYKQNRWQSQFAAALAATLMVESISWLLAHNREEAEAMLEDYIYNVDTQEFFAVSMLSGVMTNREIDIMYPDSMYPDKSSVYCTRNAIYLLDFYLKTKNNVKFSTLMAQIERDIPIIDSASNIERGRLSLEIAKIVFIRYRNSIGYSSPFDNYLKKMIIKHKEIVESELQSVTKNSDFSEISSRIEFLLEYAWQIQDFTKGKSICDHILGIIESKKCIDDPVVESRINQLDKKLKQYLAFFKFMNGEPYSDVDTIEGFIAGGLRRLSDMRTLNETAELVCKTSAPERVPQMYYLDNPVVLKEYTYKPFSTICSWNGLW